MPLDLNQWWLLPFVMTCLVGIICPATGAILITHRRLLQANLISHSVLPGLALALAIGVDPAWGGIISGLFGALIAEKLALKRSENNEAVINTVLAGSLGLGVLLIPLLGIRVDLEAILFGDLLTVGWTDVVRTLIATSSLLLLVRYFYQQMVYIGLDPEGAAAFGLKVTFLRVLIGLVTSIVVVSSMAAVGIILVIGLLSSPALIGLAQAPSLGSAILRSSLIGFVLVLFGFVLSLTFNLSPGPLIGLLCIALLMVCKNRVS